MQRPSTLKMGVMKAFALCTLLVGGACSPTEPAVGEGAVVVQTQLPEYAAGDSVYLSIHNISQVAIGYVPCPLFLDRREGTRWIEHGPALLTICDLIVLGIEPGEVRSQPVRLPEMLPAGTYRLRFEGLAPAERFFETQLPLEFRVSNPFAVR